MSMFPLTLVIGDEDKQHDTVNLTESLVDECDDGEGRNCEKAVVAAGHCCRDV